MTPEERQMLAGLFDRIRSQATAPRDREAEAFIASAVREQPYAAYLLAQTVLVQEQALKAATEQLQELQDHVRQGDGSQGGGSFLGDLGRSIFGGPPSRPSGPPRGSVPGYSPNQPPGYAPQPGYPPQGYAPQQGYAQPQSGPWGGQPAPAAGGGGGSFLRGALGTAAGVAGGVLLADTVRDMFAGHNSTLANMAGGSTGGLFGSASANTLDVDQRTQDILQDQDQDQDDAQDAADDFGGSDSDDSYDV